MVRALLNDEAARRYDFADEFTETVHRAIGVPSHVRKQFQGVAADGESEQVGLPFGTFPTCRFVEGNLRQMFQAGRHNQPTLVRLIAGTEYLEEMLRLLELPLARLPNFVDRARANHQHRQLHKCGESNFVSGHPIQFG